MPRPQAADAGRARALAAVDAGQRVAAVATFVGNDPSTIYGWVRHRASTGSGLARPRAGRPRLLSAAPMPALAAPVAAAPEATLADHCAQWAGDQGIRPGVSTMSRWRREWRFTLKKSR